MSKKSENSVEKTDNNETKKHSKFPMSIVFVAVLIIAGTGIWYNFDKIKDDFSEIFHRQEDKQTAQAEEIPEFELISMIEEKADRASLSRLQEQLLNLQTLVNELVLQNKNTADISNLNQRIDNMQDLLIASVNGKADAQSVLGLIVRIDKLESEVERVSRLNNDGAIMLATTMLIKENALDGRDFSFEAGILQELAGNNPKIDDALQTIAKSAEIGISTNEQIKSEFLNIYKSLNNRKNEQEVAKTWKDRLISKINELITINKIDEKQTNEQQEKDAFMSALKELSNQHKFIQIANLINNSDNVSLKSNDSLQKWIEKVQNKENFEAAINKISSYSLMLMKLNNLVSKAE